MIQEARVFYSPLGSPLEAWVSAWEDKRDFSFSWALVPLHLMKPSAQALKKKSFCSHTRLMQLYWIPAAMFALLWAPLKANVGCSWAQVSSMMRTQVEIWVSWLCRCLFCTGQGALCAVWI